MLQITFDFFSSKVSRQLYIYPKQFCLLHHICMWYFMNSWLERKAVHGSLSSSKILSFSSHKYTWDLINSWLESWKTELFTAVCWVFPSPPPFALLSYSSTWFCCLFHPLILVSDPCGSLMLFWFSFVFAKLVVV